MSTTVNDRSLTKADLNQFTGDLLRYTHPLNRSVLYTPGIRYVAEAGQAYWLIDAVASYFGTSPMTDAMKRDPRIQRMQFWRLEVEGLSAVLTATADSGEEPFIQQEISYTDFPLKSIDIWAGYDGSFWTLYLPSEH